MRERFTNAYNSLRTNSAVYIDQAKRVMQFAWHLTSSSANSAWQFLSTNSLNVWSRLRGTQATATNDTASSNNAATSEQAAQNTSTASFAYTQITRPVNWLYQRASVNLPSFLRTQPAVSPVAESSTSEPASQNRLG